MSLILPWCTDKTVILIDFKLLQCASHSRVLNPYSKFNIIKYSSANTSPARSEVELCAMETKQHICFVHCLVIIGWRVEGFYSEGCESVRENEQMSPSIE